MSKLIALLAALVLGAGTSMAGEFKGWDFKPEPKKESTVSDETGRGWAPETVESRIFFLEIAARKAEKQQRELRWSIKDPYAWMAANAGN